MYIYIIHENQKVRVGNDTIKSLKVKEIVAKIQYYLELEDVSDFSLINDEEIFYKDEKIDFNKYKEKVFFLHKNFNIKHYTNISKKKPSDKKKSKKVLNLTTLIKIATNAKTEMRTYKSLHHSSFMPEPYPSNIDEDFISNYSDHSDNSEDKRLKFNFSELNSNIPIITPNENIIPITSARLDISSDNENDEIIYNHDLEINQIHLATLVGMGYPLQHVENILRLTNNNLQLSMEVLIVVPNH